MGIVKRFRTHEEFEKSCYKLGIYWVPPIVIKNFTLRQKQVWQRKVLCGKIKVRRPFEDGTFVKRYKEALKEATRVNGKIDIDSIPEEFHNYFLEKQAQKKYWKRYRNIIRDKDRKVYLHKWYPWSYNRDGEPSLVLQGYYSKKEGRRRYILYYGEEGCKHVHWIKGRSALEREFKVGKTLKIDGKYKRPISKILLTESYRDQLQVAKDNIGRELFKKKFTKAQQKEKYLLNLVDKFNYGTKEYRTVLKPKSEKQIRLSKTKETEAKRKKLIYEE